MRAAERPRNHARDVDLVEDELGGLANLVEPLLPELPTVSEAGLKGFEANNWYPKSAILV